MFCGKSTRSTSGEWAGFLSTAGCVDSGPCSLTAVLPSLRNIATIAVFYALPVVQLVITYQTVRGQGPAVHARLCHSQGHGPKGRASPPQALD